MATSGALPRWVEVPAAVLGLLLLSPVLLVAAVAIKATSPGPVFFRQQRVGRRGRPFWLCKLRTMRVRAGGPRITVRGDARVTLVGAVLRHLKLDELPELWNVIRGEMALVGPRPEVVEHVDLTSVLWQDVLSVRPGITDPVTLHLRNEEVVLAHSGDDAHRFYQEVLQPFKLLGYRSYLERRSWRSDLRVLVQTVRAVLLPSSVSPASVAEMQARVQVWKDEECGKEVESRSACVPESRGDNQSRRR
jgi:lipopolysaccharide/colanic/teichoic acid biosynthesis glycosyltransferase